MYEQYQDMMNQLMPLLGGGQGMGRTSMGGGGQGMKRFRRPQMTQNMQGLGGIPPQAIAQAIASGGGGGYYGGGGMPGLTTPTVGDVVDIGGSTGGDLVNRVSNPQGGLPLMGSRPRPPIKAPVPKQMPRRDVPQKRVVN